MSRETAQLIRRDSEREEQVDDVQFADKDREIGLGGLGLTASDFGYQVPIDTGRGEKVCNRVEVQF